MADITLSLIVLRCRDIAASLDFYQRLGLRFVPEQHSNGPLHYAAMLRDTVIELYPQRNSDDGIEPLRIGFAVRSLTNCLQALREISIELITPSDKRVKVRDPDGRIVVLNEQDNESRQP